MKCEISRRWVIAAGMKALMGAVVLLNVPALGGARNKEPQLLKFVGLATEIEPTRVTIRGNDGRDLTLSTTEDFTEKAAVGSKVTAWYYSENGSYVLKSLDSPREIFFRPASEIRSGIKKIIILPSSNVPDSALLFDAISKYLESNLGWYVAPRVLAEEIRGRAGRAASTLDAIDPTTGQFDAAAYTGGEQDVIRRVASETRVDAVLEAKVEQVSAKVKRMLAAWDGVEEPVAGKGQRTIAKFAFVPEHGKVPASTVVLKLWDSQRKLLWSNRRGFAVLAVVSGMNGKSRERPLAEFAQDPASVDRWLTMALGSLLPGAAPEKATAKR